MEIALIIGAFILGGAIVYLTYRNRLFSERLAQDQRAQFEGLTQRIIQDSAQRLNRENELLLSPLKERLGEFSKRVEESYISEAKERHTLKHEIERLITLNQQMSQDAVQLTQALRGSSKTQGDWGEIQLTHILERAGLREGEEYITQGKNLDLQDESGLRQKPDVVVMLPENKHIIIDSKVSLTAYCDYVQSEDESEQKRRLSEHATSLRTHIENLAGKHYQHSRNLNAPDFVLLFMPIEPALSEALKLEPSLMTFAWERKIVIASPTLLFAFLRTIATLWVRDRQSKNALTIAEEGGKLYDKFVAFLEDMQGIGASLRSAQTNFDASMLKLSEGKGNLIGRVEKLRELGAKTKKRLQLQEESAASPEELPPPTV